MNVNDTMELSVIIHVPTLMAVIHVDVKMVIGFHQIFITVQVGPIFLNYTPNIYGLGFQFKVKLSFVQTFKTLVESKE